MDIDDNMQPRQIDENISLTRFANLLTFYSGEEKFNKISKVFLELAYIIDHENFHLAFLKRLVSGLAQR